MSVSLNSDKKDLEGRACHPYLGSEEKLHAGKKPYFVVCGSSPDLKSDAEHRQYKSCENSFCRPESQICQNKSKDKPTMLLKKASMLKPFIARHLHKRQASASCLDQVSTSSPHVSTSSVSLRLNVRVKEAKNRARIVRIKSPVISCDAPFSGNTSPAPER